MHDKMKPCPHCGGTAALNRNYSYRLRLWFVYARCEICGAQGKICREDEEPEPGDWHTSACDAAVEAWNMRTKEE